MLEDTNSTKEMETTIELHKKVYKAEREEGVAVTGARMKAFGKCLVAEMESIFKTILDKKDKKWTTGEFSL